MKKRKYIIIMIIGIILITAGICIYSINYTKIDNKNNQETNTSDENNISKALTILENLNLDTTFEYSEKISENEYKFLDQKNSTTNEKIYYIINIETENYQIETETKREIS